MRTRRPALRSLEALAVENAVEGCVRETMGALFAMHQAASAADPHVRATMVSIAPDETRHAALGWAVAEWALDSLRASLWDLGSVPGAATQGGSHARVLA